MQVAFARHWQFGQRLTGRDGTGINATQQLCKRSCVFLAADRWKRNLSRANLIYAGCGLSHFLHHCAIVQTLIFDKISVLYATPGNPSAAVR